MKQNNALLALVALILICTPSLASLAPEPSPQFQTNTVQTDQKIFLATFNNQIKDYLKQRSQVKEKLLKLSKDATPEQIQAYQVSFVDSLRALRAGNKAGDIFEPKVSDYIRAIIKDEFKGQERTELREAVLEADTKGVPLRVNYPYPDTKELAQTPPTLLLRLPQLPKEVKYRFVGTSMLLVDTDNGLIVDYMTKALP